MSTYKRLGDLFYKTDGERTRAIKFTISTVLIELVETIPSEAVDVKEEEYILAVTATTKFSFVGDRPDIPPPLK